MCIHKHKLIHSSDADIYLRYVLFSYNMVFRLKIYITISKNNVDENYDVIKWYCYVNNMFM